MFEDIDWYNGLLLKPQHMQTIKLLNYFKIVSLIQSYNENFYGIINIVLDVSKVHEGILTINELKAINKDGTVIDYDINQKNEYKLSIDMNKESNLENDIEQIYLYLATINYNSKSSTGNYDRYYKSGHGPIIDDSQSEHDEYLHVLKPKPMLFFEKDLLPKYSYLPLIKLKRNKGIWQILQYHPPYFIFEKTHPIVIDSKNIFNYMTKKLEELSVKIIHDKQYQSLDHKTIIDMHNYEIIMPHYNKLKQILSEQKVKPYELFLVLNEILSSMMFSLSRINTLDIRYEHDKMFGCLSVVINKINDIIADVLQQNIILINFEPGDNKNQIFISIPQDYKLINNYLYCFCSSEKFNKEFIYKMIEDLVIYSETKQQIIKNLRISGINREVIKQFSNVKELVGLSGIANAVCFRINADDVYFDYNDRLIIELDEDQISYFKFNIVLKQN